MDPHEGSHLDLGGAIEALEAPQPARGRVHLLVVAGGGPSLARADSATRGALAALAGFLCYGAVGTLTLPGEPGVSVHVVG